MATVRTLILGCESVIYAVCREVRGWLSGSYGTSQKEVQREVPEA